jgi:hypothetical protein
MRNASGFGIRDWGFGNSESRLDQIPNPKSRIPSPYGCDVRVSDCGSANAMYSPE